MRTDSRTVASRVSSATPIRRTTSPEASLCDEADVSVSSRRLCDDADALPRARPRTWSAGASANVDPSNIALELVGGVSPNRLVYFNYL